MSNPSPEPSAESLAEARELRISRTEQCEHGALFGPPTMSETPYRRVDCQFCIALALDAAKRSSRREALGQAADVVGGMKQRRMRAEILRGLDDTEDADGWGPLTLSELALMKGVESALRALMEAE